MPWDELVQDQPAHDALRFVGASASGEAVGPDLRVTLNFQPDRLVGDELVVEDGMYVSQFVSRISNGGLTAHGGGVCRAAAAVSG